MAFINKIDTYLQVAKALNLNIALVGAHGRAKTAYMKKFSQKEGYELIVKILAQFEPTDFVGLPSTTVNEDGVEVTSNLHPDWLVDACDPNKKVLLFFDEFNNGDPDVQASILNLIEDRQCNGLTLNDDTLIVMAFNPPEIAPNARRLSKATRDRICVIPIVDNNRPYQEYYRDEKMDALADLLDDMPDLISNYDEAVKECAYENAEFTYRSLQKAYQIVDYGIKNGIPEGVTVDLVSGYGGKYGAPVAKQLISKIKDQEKNSVFDDVIKTGDYKKINKLFNDNIDKFNNMGYADIASFVNKVKKYMNSDDFDKFIHERFNQEFIEAYQEESE